MNVKNATWSAVMLGLLGGSFVFGMFVGERHTSVAPQVASVVHIDGDVLSEPIAASSSDPVDFTPYWRVWNTLERKFIPFGTTTNATVDPADRMYASIEGLVASYKDPYTVFMRPQTSEDFKMITRGALEGIGAVIGERDGALMVVQPLQGSPAEHAGLVPGDIVLKVDGVAMQGMTVESAVGRIRGQGGTTVTLTIQTGEGEPRDVPITRGTIEIPSTAHAVVERVVPKVAVTDARGETSSSGVTDGAVETETKEFYMLRLFSFSQTSVAAFERELRAFIASGADSLIIDLRGNPGGYLEAAVDMASWFLPDGAVVVREFRGPDKVEFVHRARGHSLFGTEYPKIAVVVDKSSASASEILAGALKEHGVATIVGTNTFGKGSVQELVDITPELALKVTVARWYTPNGVSISDGGLTPDIVVDVTQASSSEPVADPFIEAAVDYLIGA